MKNLERIDFDESEVLKANEMLGFQGGGWTSNPHNTYVGQNGDCHTICDSTGGDRCGPDDQIVTMSPC